MISFRIFFKEEIIQPALNTQKDIGLIKTKLKEYKMNKESNRNLAFLLSTVVSDDDLDDVSGGASQAALSAAPTFLLTGSRVGNADMMEDKR